MNYSRPHATVPSATADTTPSWRWLVLMCVAYLLPGIVGHDPWKPDEAYIFGSIYHMIQSGDWVVPYVGGEPFVEKPQLFHWVAVLLAKTAAPVLPLHDGARLASTLFVVISLIAVAFAARLTWGPGSGRNAVLLSLSSLGLVEHAHMMLPDLPHSWPALRWPWLVSPPARGVCHGLVFWWALGPALAFLPKD